MLQVIDKPNPALSKTSMTGRRVLFAFLLAASFVALSALMFVTLSPGGHTPLDFFILGCFMVTLPWTIIGFWNAVIGLLVMRLSKDPVAAVCPIAHGDASQSISSSTALLSCIKDEDVDALETNLTAMASNLIRAGSGP